MTTKLPINFNSLFHHRTIESERVEYKAGWNPEAVRHSIFAFANKFHNLGGGYVVVGVEEPVCTSQDVTNLTPPKDSPIFLGYYLKANGQQNLAGVTDFLSHHPAFVDEVTA